MKEKRDGTLPALPSTWATEALAPGGAIASWIAQRPFWNPSRPDYRFEVQTCDDGAQYVGALPRPPADSETYVFHVAERDGGFGVCGGGSFRDLGVFATMAAALTAGADHAEGIQPEIATAA